MHANELWHSKAAVPRLARLLLAPASWLYALGWQGYLAIYRLGIKRASEPHVPVVCVGNLLAGGSGKSPLTLHLYRILKRNGRAVVLGCSGYGSPKSEAAQLAPEGPLSAREWGDEPAMMRWLEPDAPLVVGRRRVLAAELCHHLNPDAVLLMDDGFQHLPLKKHLSILLDPADPPNRMCLPAGPYREPRRNRKRADSVLPGHFRTVYSPTTFCTPEGEVTHPENYALVCALGQPEQFLESVTLAVGQAPALVRFFPDHDPLDAGNLFDGFEPSHPIVVTAKDWMKLRERSDAQSRRFLIAIREVSVEPAQEFESWLLSKLNG